MALRIPQLYSISEVALGGKLNRVNDPVAGGSIVSGNTVPGGGVANSQNLRAGQLGFEVELDAAEALRLSDTSIGTLFAGTYMYVQLGLGGAQPLRGNVAFISSIANGGNYIVSGDAATAGTLLRPVGVFINTITLGNFGWIQVSGLASLQFATAITNETDGALVKIVNQTGLGVGQQIAADLTASITDVLVSAYVKTGMYAAELPVDNTITRVWMRPLTRLI